MNGGRGEPEAGHRTWPAWTGRWLGPVLIAVVLAFAAILDLDEHDAVNTALGAFVVVAAAALMIVAWRRPRAGLALPGLTMVSCLAPALGRAIGHPGIEPPVPGALTLVGAATVTAWAGARRADRRWAVRLVASSGLSILALPVVAERTLYSALPVVALIPAIGLVGLAVWLREQAGQRERAVVDARNAERLEIARELHDVVAHHVTGIVVLAQAGPYLAAADSDGARRLFAEIEEAGRVALTSMRQVLIPLRGADDTSALALPSLDVAEELRALASSAERAGARVTLAADAVPPELGPTIVRLTREALTNVLRHGRQVTRVEVRVVHRDHAVDWSVVNDGEAARPAGPPGMGLVGLRERVDALGGTFQAGPDGSGWRTSACIPVRAPQPAMEPAP